MLASTEDGVDSGHEDRQLEGLCDVVVPADVQPHNDAGFRIGGGKENNGDLGGLPDLLQNSNPEPSGRETSRTSRSYFPSCQRASASRSVRAMSSSWPAF